LVGDRWPVSNRMVYTKYVRIRLHRVEPPPSGVGGSGGLGALPGIDVRLFAEYGPRIGQCSFAKPVQSHVLFHNKPIIRNWLRRYDYAREKPNFSPDFLFRTRLCRKHNRHTRLRSVTPACHTLLSCHHQSSSPRRITAAGAEFLFLLTLFGHRRFHNGRGVPD